MTRKSNSSKRTRSKVDADKTVINDTNHHQNTVIASIALTLAQQQPLSLPQSQSQSQSPMGSGSFEAQEEEEEEEEEEEGNILSDQKERTSMDNIENDNSYSNLAKIDNKQDDEDDEVAGQYKKDKNENNSSEAGFNQKDLPTGDDHDPIQVEKKQAKSSWELAQSSQCTHSTMDRQDWKALGLLTALALVVRLWRIDRPGEVVMDEGHMGKYVNAYLNGEFAFDRHPPLGKLILTAFSSRVGHYDGSFDFKEIGDDYPKNLPFVAMRSAMALLGALCAPIIFMTVRAMDQSIYTAVLASILITFDNALTANNRLMTLDAPLLFFTALTFLSWSMFTKQQSLSGRDPGRVDYDFNLLSYPFRNSLIRQKGSPSLEGPPNGTFLGNMDHILEDNHYNNISNGDDDESEYLIDPIWKDVYYGSVVQLRSEIRPPTYLHSFNLIWRGGSKQQQVAGYEYRDPNTRWIMSLALPFKQKIVQANGKEESQEAKQQRKKLNDMAQIPDRLRKVRHGDIIKLRHVPTRKCLHSHNVKLPNTMAQKGKKNRFFEVSAYGLTGDRDGDSNDWWIIEVVDSERWAKMPKASASAPPFEQDPNDKGVDIKVKALETTFRLRHHQQKCYLSVMHDEVPETQKGGRGRRVLGCVKDAKVNARSTWRITLNDHDYLPMDTELASYPKLSFFKKMTELHLLMWTKPRAFETTSSYSDESKSSPSSPSSFSVQDNPRYWPLAPLLGHE
ncbi:hypothetical protein BX616_004852, partial [Lobosporangium transversale]